MQLTFGDRTAVVTGAGRGIGKAIASRLAGAGLHVICVSRNESSCGQTAQELVDRGLKAEALAVDVSNPDSVTAAAAQIEEKHGAVQILVNNAGITKDGLLFRMKDEDWNLVLQTNLNAAFYWTRALGQNMTRQRWGRIVNVGSVIGLIGNAGQVNYAAAKAGLMGFTKSVAREFAKRSVTVNLVAPGFIETDMTAVLSDAVKDSILKQIPLGKMGSSEDVANLVAFLCSEESGYVTGQTFTVDGGMVM